MLLSKVLISSLKGLLSKKETGYAEAEITGDAMKISFLQTRDSQTGPALGFRFTLPAEVAGLKSPLRVEVDGDHAHALGALLPDLPDRLRLEFSGARAAQLGLIGIAQKEQAARLRYRFFVPPGCPIFFEESRNKRSYPDIGELVEIKGMHPSTLVGVAASGETIRWANGGAHPRSYLRTQIEPTRATATNGHQVAVANGIFPTSGAVHVDNKLLAFVGKILDAQRVRAPRAPSVHEQTHQPMSAAPPAVRVGMSQSHMVFQGGRWEVAIPIDRTVTDFPDVSEILTSSHEHSVAVEVGSLMAFLESVEVVRKAKRGKAIASLKVGNGVQAGLYIEDHINGSTMCAISCAPGVVGGPGEQGATTTVLGINPKYLRRALERIPGDVVVIETSGREDSVRFSNPERSVVSIIMPLRAQTLEEEKELAGASAGWADEIQQIVRTS